MSLLLDPGQPDAQALVLDAQPLAVDAEASLDRRVEVPDVDRVLDDVVAEVSGSTVDHAAADLVDIFVLADNR